MINEQFMEVVRQFAERTAPYLRTDAARIQWYMECRACHEYMKAHR